MLHPNAQPQMPPGSPPHLRPCETARYTYEMLESLRKIAERQQQELLAHLLYLAATEAKTLSGQDDHDTSLPE